MFGDELHMRENKTHTKSSITSPSKTKTSSTKIHVEKDMGQNTMAFFQPPSKSSITSPSHQKNNSAKIRPELLLR